jgi:hypothetical protein
LTSPIQFIPLTNQSKLFGPTLSIYEENHSIWHCGELIDFKTNCGDLTNSIVLLLGVYYAYGLSYPKSYASVMGFLQATLVEPIDFKLSDKVLKLVNQFKQL